MSRRYRLSLLMGCPAGGVSCTGTCSPCRCGSRRGACPLCRPPALPPRCLVGWRGCFGRLPTPPLVYFPAPLPRRGRISPLPPFPSGEGGDFLFSYARGFAPCIPGAERGAALARPASPAFGGGLAFLLACQPRLWFSFLPPIPPTPFPSGEGGDFLFSYARGCAPCIPGIRPPAALTEPAKQVPSGGVPPALPARRALTVPTGGVAVETRHW